MTATIEASEGTDVDDDPPPPPSRTAVAPSLQPWHDPQPWVGRLLTLVIAVLAGFTRFWALGSPPGLNHVPSNGMNFDEIYYATEAQEMLRYGYEDNRGFLFIVHPPLGKWLIASGEWLQGTISGSHSSDAYLSNSLGWRIMPAFFGCVGVIMLMRTVRRMTRSNLFGFIAGLLMSMEGLSLVLARTAILDIFLQTFVIAAFGAMVLDRDRVRARLGALVAAGVDLGERVPTLGPRPWRLVAGVMIGLASAVKWTGAYFFIAFILLAILWDRSAFKAAGVSRPNRPWLRRSVLPAGASLVLAPVGTYLFCWMGWFAGENSWDRHWSDQHSASTHLKLWGLHKLGLDIPFSWAWLPGPIRSLGSYHLRAYRFHEGLDSGHAYASNPWSWLVLGRPVDFYYNGSETTCGSAACSREILLIGTPIMWWAFVPMLLWLGWHWFTTRDWRAGAIWVAFIAGWLVWFQDLKRTMFLFYMAPLVPFLVIGLTLALGMMLGPALPDGVSYLRARRLDRERRVDRAHAVDADHVARAAPRARPLSEADRRALRRRTWGAAVVGGYLGLVVVDFVWMWPLFTGGLLTYDQWHAHMWLPSWV